VLGSFPRRLFSRVGMPPCNVVTLSLHGYAPRCRMQDWTGHEGSPSDRIVDMHLALTLALLLLAVPHAAGLATPVLETVALRGAASTGGGSLRVAEGQATTIDSGA